MTEELDGQRFEQCRTCLAETTECLNVFEYELVDKVEKFLNLKILENDLRSVVMCGDCVFKLEEFVKLYNLAVKSAEVWDKLANKQIGKIEQITILEIEDEDSNSLDVADVISVKKLKSKSEIKENFNEEKDQYEKSSPEPISHVENEYSDSECSEVSEEEKTGPTRKRNKTGLKNLVKPKQKERLTQEQEDDLIRKTINLHCYDCSFSATTFEEFYNHSFKEHQKPWLQCCGRKFRARSILLQHAKFHMNPNQFSCNICSKQFSLKAYLSDHMHVHVPDNERKFQCPECPKKFSKRSRLTLHEKSHNNELNFVCKLCNKGFNQKIVLDSHIKFVHNTKIICEVCTKTFKTKDAFESHKDSHLDVPPPKLDCEVCGAKLKNKLSLKNHLRRHKILREKYVCDVCNKQFNSKGNLKMHKTYVHSAPSLKCTYCEKEFKRPIVLKEHEATHTGAFLYMCSFCPKRFKSNANKYTHQKNNHPVEWALTMQKKES